MGYVLSIDQGTTSTRSVVYDAAGRCMGMASCELTQHYPQPGWVEHDADEIWRSVARVVPEALAGAGIAASQLVALGVTNQRETVVLWDRRSGRPVAPAPSSGRIGARGSSAASMSRRRAGLPRGRGWSSIPTSPRPRFAGCCGKAACGSGRRRASWRAAPSTAGCCGTSPPARSMPPTPRMRRARCSSTFGESSGTTTSMRVLRRAQFSVAAHAPQHGDVRHDGDLDLPAGIAIAGVAGDQQAALFARGGSRRGRQSALTGRERSSCSTPANSFCRRATGC